MGSQNQIRVGRELPGGNAGFSLIELLIVIAIILVIAAIAIPNLLSSRIAAHEASAVNTLRTFTTANVTYASQCPSIGYAAVLSDLGPGTGACTGGANIVDPTIGVDAPVKSGYSFTYVVTPSGSLNTNYTLHADPSVAKLSGNRSFFTDETGVLHYAFTPPASAASSVLE